MNKLIKVKTLSTGVKVEHRLVNGVILVTIKNK